MPDKTALVPVPPVPLARRRKRANFRLSARVERAVMNRMTEEMSRDEIADVLEHDDDPRTMQFLALLLNPPPGQQAMTIYTAAQRCDLTWNEIIHKIRKSRLDIGILRVSRHVADVMEATAIDAKSSDEKCLDCDGEGASIITVGAGKSAVQKAQVCRACRGSGSVRIKGDIENRRIIWDQTGLIRKGAFMNQNINLGGAPVESFENLIGKASEIIDAPAEPVPPEGSES